MKNFKAEMSVSELSVIKSMVDKRLDYFLLSP